MLKRIIPILIILVFGCIILSGCNKDEILNHYNNTIEKLGASELTSTNKLIGSRTQGIDDYTGTYTANYDNITTTEYLFGGTSIKRKAGKDITVTCKLTIKEGTIKLFWLSGSDDPVTLTETRGTYSKDLTLPDGANYFGVECEDFIGSIELNIE